MATIPGRVKKWYEGLPIFRVSLQNKRQKLLSDPVVIELIKAAMIAAKFGESPETFIKSMK